MVSARVRFLSLALAALITAACGHDSPLRSPTAPTDVLGSGASTERSVAFSTESGDADFTVRESTISPADHQRSGSLRELSGFVTAKGTDSITVRDITVKVEHATVIRHGHRILTLADIQVGDKVEVRGVQSGSTLVASEIKLEDTDGEGDHGKAEAKGLISGLTGTCPSLTFTVGTTRVTTNGTTEFRGTVCAAVVNGARVDIQGTRQTDGSIVATKVDTKLGEDEVRGAVAALTGTCPNLTFTVGTTRVTTNIRTEFKGSGCAGIVSGLLVEAKGTRQTDGSIIAVKVDVGLDHDDDEVEGTLSGLAGTCPNLTFTIGTTRVTTNNLTEFKGTACSAITNGVKVEAEGRRQTDGLLLAEKVDVKFDDNDEDEVEGSVSGLTGSCPNLAFTVGSARVTTNSATEFKGAACSAIVNGIAVEAEGRRQTDGSITATKIEVEHDDD